jgi:hypothetical protein
MNRVTRKTFLRGSRVDQRAAGLLRFRSESILKLVCVYELKYGVRSDPRERDGAESGKERRMSEGGRRVGKEKSKRLGVKRMSKNRGGGLG